MTPPRFTRTLAALPETVPFIAPEALERRTGRPLTVRLGANESMFGMSPLAHRAMADAVNRVHCYGDPESFELRHAIAASSSVGFDNVVVGAGIDDLLSLTVRALVEPGDPVVTSLGGYPTFAYFVEGHGGALHRVPYRDDKNDLEALAKKAHEVGAKLVYLANPDNPSGTWHVAGDVERFIGDLPPDALLILDEAYSEFAPAGAIPHVETENPRVLRMHTFSKVWGMAGARIGYATGARATMRAFEKIRAHFGVNLLAQSAALASLSDPGFAKSVVSAVEEGRRDYERMAARWGFRALPSATNFVTMDVGGVDRAKAIVAKLLLRDVFIRMPGAPPLNRSIRVSVGRKEQRAVFESAVSALLESGEI